MSRTGANKGQESRSALYDFKHDSNVFAASNGIGLALFVPLQANLSTSLSDPACAALIAAYGFRGQFSEYGIRKTADKMPIITIEFNIRLFLTHICLLRTHSLFPSSPQSYPQLRVPRAEGFHQPPIEIDRFLQRKRGRGKSWMWWGIVQLYCTGASRPRYSAIEIRDRQVEFFCPVLRSHRFVTSVKEVYIFGLITASRISQLID